jgi:hypothetical protein
MYELILKERHYYKTRLFALCESCYWTATILMKLISYQCPICLSKYVALMPLILSPAQAKEYSLDKEQTSYNDSLDALRLSLQGYKIE